MKSMKVRIKQYTPEACGEWSKDTHDWVDTIRGASSPTAIVVNPDGSVMACYLSEIKVEKEEA